MQTILIDPGTSATDFYRAKQVADRCAEELLGPSTCLSWYNRAKDRESPAHASDCHGSCDVPGYVEYAQNRDAELKIVVGRGDFVFCYRPLGEFADADPFA